MVPIAFFIDSERVDHYDGVVDMMARTEVERFQTEHGFGPTDSQVAFYRKEITRLMTIHMNVDAAQKVRIPKSSMLSE